MHLVFVYNLWQTEECDPTTILIRTCNKMLYVLSFVVRCILLHALDACFSCAPFCKAQFHSIYAYPKSILKLRWFEQNVTCKFPICDWIDKRHIHVFYFLFPQQLNFDRLLAKMWEAMGLVRVYTKPQGQQPDFSDPVVLSAVCDKLVLFFS